MVIPRAPPPTLIKTLLGITIPVLQTSNSLRMVKGPAPGHTAFNLDSGI